MAKSTVYEISIKDSASVAFQSMKIKANGAADAMSKLADMVNKVSDSLSNMSKCMSGASSGVKALEMSDVLSALETLKRTIGGLTAPYNSFESAMAAANTIAGKSGKEFDQLTSSVKGLSREVPVARDELANGLYTVISNGVPEDNWLSFLEQSAKASVGGIADLGDVVTVTSTLVKNYGLDWESATLVQDRMQTTAKNGVTSFDQLASVLPGVSGTAAQLGVSMDELMAVFATATGVTGNTSEVSMQLGAVLNSLVRPSDEACKAADAMGISFDAASVKACGGFQNFLLALDTNVQDYAAQSGQLSDTIYGQLFGSAEALAMINALNGEQREAFGANIAAMTDSAGAIQLAYDQMNSTTDSWTERLQNQALAIMDWGAQVVSATVPLMDWGAAILEACVNAQTLLPTVTNLCKWVQSWSIWAKVATGATQAWTGVQRLLNTTIWGCPLNYYVGAAALLAAGFTYLYKNCDDFREVCDKVWAVVKNLAALIWDTLVVAFEKASEVIKKAWEYIKKFFGIKDESTVPETLDEVNTSANEASTSTMTLAEAQRLLGGQLDGIAGNADKASAALQRLRDATAANPTGDAADFTSLDQYERRLDYLREKQKTATRDEYFKIQCEVEYTESEQAKFKEGVWASADTMTFTTEGQFDKQIAALESGLSRVTASERKALEARIEQVRYLKSVFLGEIEGFNWKDSGGMEIDVKPIDPSSLVKTVELPEDLKINNPLPDDKEVKKSSSSLQDGLSAAGQMMGNISGLVGDSAGAWIDYGANILQTASQAIPAIMAMTCANAANSAAQTPVVGWILAGAAIASMIAAFAAIPAFANGGIVYGPTLGLFGEYAGASGNPEVVAPLNRLKELIGPSRDGGGRYEQVDVRIDGRNLVAVLAKNGRYRDRM